MRNPKLKDRPLGVTQKYLIVTSNYAARARGVTKLMGIKDAMAKCPELSLVRTRVDGLRRTHWQPFSMPSIPQATCNHARLHACRKHEQQMYK